MTQTAVAIHPDVARAIDTIADFITRVTGQAPTTEELAGALTRYFVLNEIRDHIELERQTAS